MNDKPTICKDCKHCYLWRIYQNSSPDHDHYRCHHPSNTTPKTPGRGRGSYVTGTGFTELSKYDRMGQYQECSRSNPYGECEHFEQRNTYPTLWQKFLAWFGVEHRSYIEWQVVDARKM